MRSLGAEFSHEMMPDVLFRTVYRGITLGGNLKLRYVEAVGFDVCPHGHPFNQGFAVRYCEIHHSTGDACLGSTRYAKFDDFKRWMHTTGASVDGEWTSWAQDEMSTQARAA